MIDSLLIYLVGDKKEKLAINIENMSCQFDTCFCGE